MSLWMIISKVRLEAFMWVSIYQSKSYFQVRNTKAKCAMIARDGFMQSVYKDISSEV